MNDVAQLLEHPETEFTRNRNNLRFDRFGG